MELEDERAVFKRELDDVRSGAFLSRSESRAGLGIETCDPCGEYPGRGGFAFRFRLGNVNAIEGKPVEAREQ